MKSLLILGNITLLGMLFVVHGVHDNKVQNLTIETKKIPFLELEIEELKTENSKLSRIVEKAFLTSYHNNTVYGITVSATGYTASVDECDGEPWYTASMELSRVGMIAVSQDLESIYGIKLGTLVIIEGMGLFRVSDRMNSRWTNRIDILMGNKEAAYMFGIREVNLLWLGNPKGGSNGF